MSGEPSYSLVNFIFQQGQIIVLMLAGISTTVISLLAIKNFVQESARLKAEWKRLKMSTTNQLEKEKRHILITMLLVFIFFLISCGPILVNIILQSINYYFYGHYLYAYLSYWLFLAGSAWRPWVFNFRSQLFKSDLAKVLQKVLPKGLRGKLHSRVTPPLEWQLRSGRGVVAKFMVQEH